MTNFTVLGAGGFVGGHLAASLRDKGDVYAPAFGSKDAVPAEIFRRDLGHVFYCIGLTADFRQRPFDTVEAHVCLLRQILERASFDSLTYLSSTRVYQNAATTHESSALQVSSDNPSDLYNLSKLMGESLCLASGRNTRVARLSNVYGKYMPQQNFIGSILKDAAHAGKVHFLTSKNAAKDYVSVDDVTRWLPEIALSGLHSIYNLASGHNTSNEQIAAWLERRGIATSFAEHAPEWSFPAIDTGRVTQEFGGAKGSLAEEFDGLACQPGSDEGRT